MNGASQLELRPGRLRNQGLFSERVLEELPGRPEFAATDPGRCLERLGSLWQSERSGLERANEGETEDKWIRPVLDELGFHYNVFPALDTAGRSRYPDYALYLSETARLEAHELEGNARYATAVCVADAKRFDRPLDVRGGRGALSEDPVAQIIHYVAATRCPFGILTNGRRWRLYGRDRDLIEGAYYEADLVALLEAQDIEGLRTFLTLFSAASFDPSADGGAILARVLSESRATAIGVSEALAQQVFGAVPSIATGLLGGDERTRGALDLAYDHALVLLYRLLFCLYAEARGLLPVSNPHYFEYSLRKQKEDLAADLDGGRAFSSQSDDLYNDLRALFRIVDNGDDQVSVSEYNGGLFAAGEHPYFEGRSVPDHLFAPALDRLYRIRGGFVDYADLSVRHLGTIYERLLDYRLEEEDGEVALVPAPGRHESGSYFTPERVVDRIVERTLGELLDERSRRAAEAGQSGDEALETLLSIRVLDPAMGSGHFLVAAVGWIAQHVATDPSYDGELTLEDIQRRVAERCIYGVDLNPMAVELAQLSLWLTTAKPGEPLTFLSNLRAGNTLVGASLSSLLEGDDTIFGESLARETAGILGHVEDIAQRESRTGTDVHEKHELAVAVEALRKPLEQHADQAIAGSFTEDPNPFHWELEFPEVFLDAKGRLREDAGFDALIGNPPYVRIQEMGRELANWCREVYETASGSFDTYVPFIERGTRLLSGSGRLGFIVPNKFTKLDYAKRLRQWLTADALIEELVDFGDAPVFAGTTNYTCVLLLDRSGHENFRYHKVAAGSDALDDALTSFDRVPEARFSILSLGSDPWVLATGEERRLLDSVREGSETLGDVTEQIFTGLQTSADKIYVLGDRGARAGKRLLYSAASEAEVELEPDLLHPLASGGDVDRYAFAPPTQFLIFPYTRDEGEMRLLHPDELAERPLTATYLHEHEESLRARERSKMDHDGWYAYNYPKSLGAHDQSKLGVPRLCARLRAACDGEGEIYLDNVDVNGIVPGDQGPSVWTLGVLLNSRLLGYVFRRGTVPFRGDFLSANKQFIAPLPIRIPGSSAASKLDDLGKDLHRLQREVLDERQGFLGWLGDAVSSRVADIPGSTKLARYEELTAPGVLEVLRAAPGDVGTRAGTRAFRDQLRAEHESSSERIGALAADLRAKEREADDDVFELYEVTAEHRKLVDAEYEQPTGA